MSRRTRSTSRSKEAVWRTVEEVGEIGRHRRPRRRSRDELPRAAAGAADGRGMGRHDLGEPQRRFLRDPGRAPFPAGLAGPRHPDQQRLGTVARRLGPGLPGLEGRDGRARPRRRLRGTRRTACASPRSCQASWTPRSWTTAPSRPRKRSATLTLKPEDVAQACLFLATLPPRAYVPELTIVPTAIQALGKTSTATPPVSQGDE